MTNNDRLCATCKKNHIQNGVTVGEPCVIVKTVMSRGVPLFDTVIAPVMREAGRQLEAEVKVHFNVGVDINVTGCPVYEYKPGKEPKAFIT